MLGLDPCFRLVDNIGDHAEGVRLSAREIDAAEDGEDRAVVELVFHELNLHPGQAFRWPAPAPRSPPPRPAPAR